MDIPTPEPTIAVSTYMKIVMRLVKLGVLSLLMIAGLVVGLGLVVRQPTFGRIEFDGGSRADPGRLRRHVEFLAEDVAPRSWKHETGLQASRDYIIGELEESGVTVDLQRYLAGDSVQHNVIGRIGGSDEPIVFVGAHYDAYGSMAGADDNASGVAGLLELGRLLGSRRVSGGIELVAYSTEEPPWFGSDRMGSSVHARSLAEAGRGVSAMICLEMIGYFTERQPDQGILLDRLYPGHGQFIVVAGRWQDRQLTKRVKRAFRGATDLAAVSYSGPTLVGTDLSDHRNYWIEGWPAVMVSDTAFLRNPNYHQPSDTADTLDYERMAATVDGVLGAILDLVAKPL
jgi:Zn-dependent M28 family amino/carboxypeptidase